MDSVVEGIKYDTEGNLKRSVSSMFLSSNFVADTIKFEPPLPEWKQKAITNMGYGNLNKIVLVFEKIFWDSTIHTFGRLNESTANRGEMFMFFSNGTSPVLVGLLAGAASTIMDKMSDDIIVTKAMAYLANIFGSACEDYDILAKPLVDSNGRARVFFAGEHTNRQYPATVHGAFLSGIREAAKIADQFLGIPLPLKKDDETNNSKAVQKEKKSNVEKKETIEIVIED